MTKQVTIALDEEVLAFIDQLSGGNISKYINDLLIEQRRSVLKAELAAAHQEDAQNLEYLKEIALWDAVVGDGIGDEVDA